MNRKDVMKQWDKVSRNYSESRNPNGPETELIKNLLEKFDEEPRVLDVGCGDGKRTLSRLTNSSIGLDISREGLKIASENVSNSLVQGDMVDLPFRKDSFDAITAYFAVFHVQRENHGDVYNEFDRVLNDNGVILMTLPSGNYETVRRGWMGGRMLFSTPSRQETLSKIKEAGFEKVETTVSSDPFGGNAEFVIAEK